MYVFFPWLLDGLTAKIWGDHPEMDASRRGRWREIVGYILLCINALEQWYRYIALAQGQKPSPSGLSNDLEFLVVLGHSRRPWWTVCI